MPSASGLKGYNVRLDGVKINTAPIADGQPFPYLGAASATDYSTRVTITAVDNAGNESDPVTLADLGKTLVTAPPALEGTDLPSATRDAIDAIVATKLKPNTTVDGAIIAVDTPDGQYYKAFGGDRTSGLTLTLDHKMRFGSCSKMWCSLLILNRISEGYIGLNDPVAMYVDNIPNGDRITIRMLLQNRSGLKDYLQQDPAVQQAYFLTPTATYDPMQYIRSTPPVFEPDARCEYSNPNWILLGKILEWVDAHHLRPDAPRDARTIILEDSCVALGLDSVEWPTGNYMATPYSRGWAINLALPQVKAAVAAARASLGILGWFLPQDPIQLVAMLQQLGLGPQFGIPAGLQLTPEIELTAVSTSWSGAAGSLDGPVAGIVKFMKQLPDSDLISDELKQIRAETFCTYLAYEPASPWSGPGWMGHGLGIITWGDWWGWIGNLGGYKCTAFVNHLTGAVIVVMMNHMAAEDLDCFYQIAYLVDPASTLTVPDFKVELGSVPSAEAFGELRTIVWQQPGDEFGTVGVPHRVPYVVGIHALDTRNLKPPSIPSGEAFGGVTVLKAINDPLEPTSITSGEMFGDVTITTEFTPITEININRTNQQVPVGATEWRVRLTGGGAAGANGGSNTGSGVAVGGPGGGGGAGLDTGWQPIALLGSTYSVQRGLGATTPGGNGTASTFTSGGVSLSAGGGTGQAGGTCYYLGLSGSPFSASAGGLGGNGRTGTTTGDTGTAGGNASGIAGAGGGGGGKNFPGTVYVGKAGGNSPTQAGGTFNIAVSGAGGDGGDADPGEGGAGGCGGTAGYVGSNGSGSLYSPDGGRGGAGGDGGGGGGGGGASWGTTPDNFGPGGDGNTVVEYR